MRARITVGTVFTLTVLLSFGFAHADYTYTTIKVPGALSTEAAGISVGVIVGTYEDESLIWHGFLYNGRTYTTLDFPGATWTHATGISGGTIVGSYEDASGCPHGFLYKGGTYTALDFPGATCTHATGISGSAIVGSYEDASGCCHGFLYNGGTYTTLDCPGAKGTNAVAISGNTIVGYYDGTSGPQIFLYDRSTYNMVNVSIPGLTRWARPTGIDGNGIIGFKGNMPDVGWLAIDDATPTPGAFRDSRPEPDGESWELDGLGR